MRRKDDLSGEAATTYPFLKEGVGRIADVWNDFAVESVIFRGSIARNEGQPHSDVDLLAVVPDNDIAAVNQINFQQFTNDITDICVNVRRPFHVVCIRTSWFDDVSKIPSGRGELVRAVTDAQTNGVVLWQYPGGS